MGQTAGKHMKGVFRPVKNYNVEERAFKEISKDKPIVAPVHKSMKNIMDEIKRGTFTNSHLIKNKTLT